MEKVALSLILWNRFTEKLKDRYSSLSIEESSFYTSRRSTSGLLAFTKVFIHEMMKKQIPQNFIQELFDGLNVLSREKFIILNTMTSYDRESYFNSLICDETPFLSDY